MLFSAISAATLGLIAASAFSQVPISGSNTDGVASSSAFPKRPIRFIVPFPPGGATDTLARIIGKQLTERAGQPVIVDNRPGAGAVVGAKIAAESEPDGYTLLLVSVAHAINQGLHKRLPYHIVRDFEPVTLAATSPLVLVVHSSVSAHSVKDLIAIAKAQPRNLTYASAGNGTAAHLAGVLFNSTAGIDVLHVPYKGGAPALLDVVSGRVSMMFPNVPTALPQVKAKRLRPLAVTTGTRSAEMPSVPSMAEVGLSDYNVTTWYGVAVPARTPKKIVGSLNSELSTILKTPDVVSQLSRHGLLATTATPDGFTAHIRAEVAKWKKVIDSAGISVD